MTTSTSPSLGATLPTTEPLELLVSAAAGTTLISLRGEVDAANAALLRDALVAAVHTGSRFIEVDARGVSFMDSAGLGALIAGYKAAEDGSGWLRIREASAPVRHLLGVTGQLRRLMPSSYSSL